VVWTQGSLKDRVAKTNKVKLSLFVSIHHDSAPLEKMASARANEPGYAGYSVFHSARNPKPRQSMQCADQIAKALSRTGRSPSQFHENRVFFASGPISSAPGVFRHDNLFVLRNTTVPAVLVEVAVIANPVDEQQALRNRREIVKAISNGVQRCVS